MSVVLSVKSGGHRILAEGVNGFGSAPFRSLFADAAFLGFLAVSDSDHLSGAGGDGVRPDAILIADAAHAVGLADFKFLHGVCLLRCRVFLSTL